MAIQCRAGTDIGFAMAGMDGRGRKAALAAAMKEWNAQAEAWAMGEVAAAAAQAGACAGGAIPCPPKVKRLRRKRIRLLRNALNNNRQRELLMKGGGILGGIGGLLGTGLLAKGAMRSGASLLGTLAGSFGGGGCGGNGGGKGGGRGARRGGGRRGGGAGDDNVLGEVLQQALQRLAAQPQIRVDAGIDASASLPGGQSERAIDVAAEEIPAADVKEQREALALLTGCIASYLPGRARVRQEILKKESALPVLRQSLLNAGFREAEIKPSTGSVLLTWDAGAWDKAEFLAAAMPLGMHLLKSGRLAG